MINDSASAKTANHAKSPAWKAIVARYQKPAVWRAIWQLLNTLVPYAGLWYLMYLSLAVSWWLAVPLAILAGGFMVRFMPIRLIRLMAVLKNHYESRDENGDGS